MAHRVFSAEHAKHALRCAYYAYQMWQGGNQWSGYAAFLSFFDRVVELNLPEYENWRHWEAATIHGGPRIMHPDFCMVSDRPERLLIDDQNRPHCVDGPFCRWRDGSALYAIHGVRIPAWIVEDPKRITVKSIAEQTNAEVRRIMIDKYGTSKYLLASGAKLVHKTARGRLFRTSDKQDELIAMVEVTNSTPESDGSNKKYWLRVPPAINNADEAVAWTFGLEKAEYKPNTET